MVDVLGDDHRSLAVILPRERISGGAGPCVANAFRLAVTVAIGHGEGDSLVCPLGEVIRQTQVYADLLGAGSGFRCC